MIKPRSGLRGFINLCFALFSGLSVRQKYPGGNAPSGAGGGKAPALPQPTLDPVPDKGLFNHIFFRVGIGPFAQAKALQNRLHIDIEIQ
jgi:hypothetical protein